MAIDPRAIAANPLGLLIFVLAILVVRGGPIYVSSRTERDPRTRKRLFSGLESAQIALYGATGLPIIVAVTAVAMKSEHMSSSNASLLVAGGAITVLLLPMTAALLKPAHGQRTTDVDAATTSRWPRRSHRLVVLAVSGKRLPHHRSPLRDPLRAHGPRVSSAPVQSGLSPGIGIFACMIGMIWRIRTHEHYEMCLPCGRWRYRRSRWDKGGSACCHSTARLLNEHRVARH